MSEHFEKGEGGDVDGFRVVDDVGILRNGVLAMLSVFPQNGIDIALRESLVDLSFLSTASECLMDPSKFFRKIERNVQVQV